VTQKHIAIAGLILTAGGMLTAAALAHADMGSRVEQNLRSTEVLGHRVDAMESDIDDVLWNISLLCERSGANGCRSGTQ
jgi:hypothetical protein